MSQMARRKKSKKRRRRAKRNRGEESVDGDDDDAEEQGAFPTLWYQLRIVLPGLGIFVKRKIAFSVG